MERLCAGESSALAVLVGRYEKEVFRFCMHYLRDAERARDLSQETFLRVYAARGRFDSDRKFHPWLLCIARNRCLSELKRRRLVPMVSLDSFVESDDFQPLTVTGPPAEIPEAQVMAAERREMLARAVDALDEESREIIVLRFFEHMKTRDIAAVVGSSEGAIRTRLHRILRKLRELVENMDDA